MGDVGVALRLDTDRGVGVVPRLAGVEDTCAGTASGCGCCFGDAEAGDASRRRLAGLGPGSLGEEVIEAVIEPVREGAAGDAC